LEEKFFLSKMRLHCLLKAVTHRFVVVSTSEFLIVKMDWIDFLARTGGNLSGSSRIGVLEKSYKKRRKDGGVMISE